MKKIRIGKDIVFKWTILTNGENISLENRDLTLLCVDPIGNVKPLTPVIETNTNGINNVLSFKFPGVNQKQLGVYGLTLWENKGKDNQNVIDYINAFELVPFTQLESEE